MKCPADGTDLNISDRQGVEIDFCPQCRGVWLDRGEMDKIIERAGAYREPRREEDEGYVPFGGQASRYDRDDYRDERRRYEDERQHKSRKRKSFLEDLFDFD